MLSKIVAATTKTESLDYRTITSVPGDTEKQLNRVEEGAVIPSTVVKTQENLVTLRKRGRMLVASYEAIRFQRLDLFTVTLKQIGAYIARSQFKDAVGVLINGDGNNNAATEIDVATAGTLTYADLVSLWNAFDPYDLNTIIVPPALMPTILTLSEFKDAAAGQDFHGTGKTVTPLGATLLKSSAVTSGYVLGIDRSCALEMVIADGVNVDYDKLIDRQLERAAITCTAGFAKIFSDATKLLDI